MFISHQDMLFCIPTAHNMSSSKPHIIEVRFTLQRGFSFRFKPCLLRTHADLITMPNLDRLEFPSSLIQSGNHPPVSRIKALFILSFVMQGDGVLANICMPKTCGGQALNVCMDGDI